MKPFEGNQSQFLLVGVKYADAIKKTLANISKIIHHLPLNTRKSLYKDPTFSTIIRWGNRVAHAFGEEVEIEIAVDELSLGKVWDLFKDCSVIETLIKKINPSIAGQKPKVHSCPSRPLESNG